VINIPTDESEAHFLDVVTLEIRHGESQWENKHMFVVVIFPEAKGPEIKFKQIIKYVYWKKKYKFLPSS